MPTISDADWSEAQRLLRRLRDTTNDRKDWIATHVLLAKLEDKPAEQPDPHAGVYAVFNSWTRPGP